jgi:hypothetical protein
MLAAQFLPWLIWLGLAALMLAFARRPLVGPRIEVEAITTGRPRR